MVDAKLNLRVCFSLAGGKGVNTGQARDFALAPPTKKNLSSNAGEEIKRWGAVVSLTPEKL